jgi:hypothetical protein
MPALTVQPNALVLSLQAIDPTDTFRAGILTDNSNLANHGQPSGGDVFSQGMFVTHAGQIRYVDATAGLPADVVWSNGLPRTPGGHLCISTGPAATWANGIPFAANGAVATGLLV